MGRRTAAVVAAILAAALVGPAGAAHGGQEGVPGVAGGTITSTGDNAHGQRDIPAPSGGSYYRAVAAGGDHTLVMLESGAVLGYGDNTYGQSWSPVLDGRFYTAIAAGAHHSLALRPNGQIDGFGDNSQGQAKAPPLPSGVRYTAVAAGGDHSLALRSDGRIVAFGWSDPHVVPPLPRGLTYTAISVGDEHALALRSNGTVVGFGSNAEGRTTVPPLPSGVRYVAVAAGGAHSLALRSDGKIARFGNNHQSQLSLPSGDETYEYFYVAIAAGARHSLGLRSDGMIETAGDNADGQAVAPSSPVGMRPVALAAGGNDSFALQASSPRFRVSTERVVAGRPTSIAVAVEGLVPGASVYWESVGTLTLRHRERVLGRAVLRHGIVRVPVNTSTLVAGERRLVVWYSGGGFTAPGTAAAWLTVVKARPAVRIKAPKHVARGARPKVTVRIRATGLRPTGRVRVYDGRKRVRTVTLHRSRHGVVRVKLPKLRRPGKHRIHVRYAGNRQLRAGSAARTIRVRRH